MNYNRDVKRDRTAPRGVRRRPRSPVAVFPCALRLRASAVNLGSIAFADFLHQASHKGQEPRPLDRWGYGGVTVHRQQAAVRLQLTGALRHVA